MRVAWWLPLVAVWPALACADVYRCASSQGVVYQAAPCAPGQAGTLLQESAPPPMPPTPRQAAPSSREVAFSRTAVALGMSDDEALNLPGWGVPSRIERSREGRVYREEWTYVLPGGGSRRLSFANAKLTAMAIDPPMADRIVIASPR